VGSIPTGPTDELKALRILPLIPGNQIPHKFTNSHNRNGVITMCNDANVLLLWWRDSNVICPSVTGPIALLQRICWVDVPAEVR
jgi:hypothetical protein